MTRISSAMIAAILVLGCVSAVQAATPLGSAFDGRMSLVYDNNLGNVFIENAPHPNPHVQRLSIQSVGGLLEPLDLDLQVLSPPIAINSNTPNLLDIQWNAGPFLGTGLLLGDILPAGSPAPLLQADLTIMYSTSGFALTNEGDLLHTSIQGMTQANPVMPAGPGPFFRFLNVATGQFCDPPMATGYVYSMDSLGSLFTEVGMPLGLGNNFTIVSSEGTATLGEGELHVFEDGVSEFKILGISPPVDALNPAAFPVFLQFSTPTANFTMVAIPEPSTLALFGLALLGACGRFTRRR